MGVFACVNCGSPMTIVGTPLEKGNDASNCGGNDGTGMGWSKLTSTGPYAVSRSIANLVLDQSGQMRSPTRCAIVSLNAIFAASAAGGVVIIGAALAAGAEVANCAEVTIGAVATSNGMKIAAKSMVAPLRLIGVPFMPADTGDAPCLS